MPTRDAYHLTTAAMRSTRLLFMHICLLLSLMIAAPASNDTLTSATAQGSASILGNLMSSLGFKQLGGAIPAVEHLIDNMDKLRDPCRNTLRLLGAILQDARDHTGDNFATTLIELFDIPQFGSWTYAQLQQQGEQLSARMGQNYVNNIRALRQAMMEVRRLCSGQPPSSTGVIGSGTGSAPPAPPTKPAGGSTAAPTGSGVSTDSPAPTAVAPTPKPEPAPAWTVANPCPECQPIADSLAIEQTKLDAAHKKLAALNQQRADNRLQLAQIGQQLAALAAQLEAQKGTFAESFDPASGTRIRAENIGGGTVRVTIRDGSGQQVGGYDRPSWSANRAKAKKAELEAKLKQLQQQEQSLNAQVKEVEQQIPQLQQSIAELEKALADCVAKRCNKALACPQPAATEAILVGPNSKVGSGARALQKAADTAKGVLGGALGGLLGGGIGGGIGGGDSLGGGGGPSGPATVKDPVPESSKQSFTDKTTGASIRVGALPSGSNIRVSTTIDKAPGDGTFQTVYVEDGQGRRGGPIGYWIYELWRDWSLTVSWTYDHWVNNQHVEHREGGWSESGSTLLDKFKVPVWGEGEGVWSKLGFSNAANGAKGLGTDFPLSVAQLQHDPLDLVIHITQPKLDPVTTVPFVLRMSADAKGNITFTQVDQTLAQSSCGGAAPTRIADSGKLMLELGYSPSLLLGTKLGWDYGKYGDWLMPGEPLDLPDEPMEPATLTLDKPLEGTGHVATPGSTMTPEPTAPATTANQADSTPGPTGTGIPEPTTPQTGAPASEGGPSTTRERGGGAGTGTGGVKGDDPRDAPPPTTYGEEQEDGPLGVLLVRNDWSWLPRFNNQTQVTAQLYAKTKLNRWIQTGRSRVITLRFQQRSNEKGMDLNTDLPSAPQDSPDLFLPTAENGHSNCSEDPSGSGQLWGRCITRKAVSRQIFTLSSRDFGSFSALEASCDGCVALKPPQNWREGVPVEAFEANVARAEQLCKVPADDNNNQIGDSWSWELLRPNMSAKEDKDSLPQGNGVAGDGLSAYQEYRGFHVKGHHTRTTPESKDLFIDNRDHLPLQEFEKSGLVLHEVHQHELSGRRINFNQGHAHVVDQHGVILVDKKLSKDTLGQAEHGFYDTLMGRIGPPKYVDEVRVDQSQTIIPLKRQVIDNTPFTVAHELGHAVMIRHHGSGNDSTEYQVVQDSSLSAPVFPGLFSWGGPVKVPSAKLCGQTLPRKLEFGTKHNTHSGHTECFMRYRYVADAYKQEDGSIDCRPLEPAETLFCETKSGGYNAGNRVAGDASRGECAKQIQVNDK